MTISYAGPQRTWNAQRLVNRPINRPISESPAYRAGENRPHRPSPTRPGGSPMRYHGTGVAMSTAPHGRRPVTVVVVPPTQSRMWVAPTVAEWSSSVSASTSVCDRVKRSKNPRRGMVPG